MSTLGMEDAELRATQFAIYMQTNSPSDPGFNPHTGYDTTAASIGYDIVGENLAFLSTDPTWIVYVGWQDPLHLDALLTTNANVDGVSCVNYNGVAYSTYEPGACTGSACGTSTPPPPPTPVPVPTGTPTLDSEEWAFLTLINNYRGANGLGPLQVDVDLENAAQWMSDDMATNNYFSHTDSLGRSTATRLAAFNYPYSPWGEDLAAGFLDAQDTFNQWENACDPDATGACTYEHREIMLGPFTVIGIARAYNSSSLYGWYWTTDYGAYIDQIVSPTTPTSAPAIASFTAAPSNITVGQAATLSWSVTGATAVTISNGVGTVSSVGSSMVSPGQTTTYTLTATNSSGNNTAAVTVTVTAAAGAQPPTAPVLLSAVANGSTEVDLTWSASSDSMGVAGYQVSRNGSVIGSVGGTTLSYADHGVAPNITYTYTVTAYDAAGNYSNASNSLQATTGQATTPAAQVPSILSFTANPSTVSWGQVSSLSWSVNGATSLTIDNGVGNVSNMIGVRVSLQQTTTYTLTASNGAGSATARVTVTVGSATGAQPPTAPVLLSAVANGSTEVDLTWSASSDSMGVSGYQVSRNGSVVGSVSGTTLSYADHGVAPNATYTYTVTAYDAGGNYSNASNSLQATTGQATTPAAQVPSILSFTANPSTVRWGQVSSLSWSVNGAISLTIDNGVGDVSNIVGIRVSLRQTTTYTLTASNAAGSATAQVTVTVGSAANTQPPAPGWAGGTTLAYADHTYTVMEVARHPQPMLSPVTITVRRPSCPGTVDAHSSTHLITWSITKIRAGQLLT
ncbi:MAG: CAP domain-containing protein [Bryobacteraceae bacterium]